MKKLLGSATVLLLVAAPALSQTGGLKVHTAPPPPSREALNRLNLNLAWRTKLPLGGKRDGLFSLQLIPGADRPQLVVQTFSGAVILMDAETGDPLWRTSVGEPYWPAQPVAFNDSSILTTRREFLYILNRANGSHRLSKIDEATKKPIYGFALPAVPSAAPAASEAQIVFCFESRVAAFRLPFYESVLPPTNGDKAKEPKKDESAPNGKGGVSAETAVSQEPAPEEFDEDDEEKKPITEPRLRWNYYFERIHFAAPPLLTASQVGVVGTDGTFMSISLFERVIRQTYNLSGGVAASAAQHLTIAYIPSEDYTLYALDMVSGKLLWRFLGGGPILRTPTVTDRDVFVSPDRSGLFRIDRASGEEVWRNRKAERFLAVNPRFVYALDRLGNLLVLDYARGTELAGYDVRDWLILLPNDLSDRIYLAAHDGQIMCLHHRNYPQPVTNREKLALPDVPEKEKNGEKKKANMSTSTRRYGDAARGLASVLPLPVSPEALEWAATLSIPSVWALRSQAKRTIEPDATQVERIPVRQ